MRCDDVLSLIAYFLCLQQFRDQLNPARVNPVLRLLEPDQSRASSTPVSANNPSSRKVPSERTRAGIATPPSLRRSSTSPRSLTSTSMPSKLGTSVCSALSTALNRLASSVWTGSALSLQVSYVISKADDDFAMTAHCIAPVEFYLDRAFYGDPLHERSDYLFVGIVLDKESDSRNQNPLSVCVPTWEDPPARH